MRRSDHPSRPSARTCCCLLSPKTLLMTATEPRFRADVNVSAATACGGRFSGVHQWPDLGVHRGLSGVCRNPNKIRGSGSTLPPVVSFPRPTNQEVASSSLAGRTKVFEDKDLKKKNQKKQGAGAPMDPLSTCLLFEQVLAQRRYLWNVTPSTIEWYRRVQGACRTPSALMSRR